MRLAKTQDTPVHVLPFIMTRRILFIIEPSVSASLLPEFAFFSRAMYAADLDKWSMFWIRKCRCADGDLARRHYPFFTKGEVIMTKTTLALLLLVATLSGHADSGEINTIVGDGAPYRMEIPRKGSGGVNLLTTPFPRWKPLFSESICTNCHTAADDMCVISRMGINEDFVYRVAKTLQRHKNEIQRNDSQAKQPPPHAWEEDGGALMFNDSFAIVGGYVPSVDNTLDNIAQANN